MSSFKYDLSDIDPIICKEIYNLKEGNKTHIHAILNVFNQNLSFYDLIPLSNQRGLEIDLYVPSNYHIDYEGLRLSVNKQFIESNSNLYNIFEPYIDGSENIYKDDNSNSSNGGLYSNSQFYLRFPWLQNNKFPLSVWIYTIRLLMKSQNSPIWLAPIQISDKIIASKNSIKDSYRKGYGLSLIHGVGRLKGRRPYMEDRDFAFSSVNISNDQQFAMYGVLDGHGGFECSQFAADELPSMITETLRNKSNNYNYADALYNSFISADKSFLSSNQGSSGSTAVVLLIDKQSNAAYVANSGDTRAVLCRNGVSIDLSKDRKASDTEEIARIYKAGGYVTMSRVMGVLAVSRALGDRLLKETNEKKFLICDPEISVIDLIPSIDEFIVIATDGLWDVMSSELVISTVRDMLVQLQLLDEIGNSVMSETVKEKRNNSEYVSYNLRRVADQITQHAVKVLSSLDNVTVMIVLLSIDEKKRVVSLNNDALSLAISSSIIHRNAVYPIPNVSTSKKVVSKVNRSYDDMKSVVDTPTQSFALNIPTKQTQKISKPDSVDDIMEFLLDDSNF